MARRASAADNQPGQLPKEESLLSLVVPRIDWQSWVWLVVRLYLGWHWLVVGWSAQRDDASVRPIGETLIGIAILLGILTGPAALAAGVAQLTRGVAIDQAPILVATIGVMIGWRQAGRLGFDRWLLPAIAARVFVRRGKDSSPAAVASDGEAQNGT